jgi:hypothetical protein
MASGPDEELLTGSLDQRLEMLRLTEAVDAIAGVDGGAAGTSRDLRQRIAAAGVPPAVTVRAS